MQIAPTSSVAPSTHGFAYLEILEVTGADSLTVKGDLTWMLNGDERFWIFAPPSVAAQTGAIRGTHTGSTFKPAKCDSRYLWAQYRYMPPMAGYEVNPGTPGIYGKQPGTNQAGTYHAWNRQYDPGTGRWTTPDPAASPWGNLWDYASSTPLIATDPTGNDPQGRYDSVKAGKRDCIKVVIGMNDAAKDSVKEVIEDETVVHPENRVTSATEFVESLEEARAQCLIDGKQPEECCICRMSILGHGYKNQSIMRQLTDSHIARIQKLMCDDAIITSYACEGGIMKSDASPYSNYLKILGKGGGTFTGFSGNCFCDPSARLPFLRYGAWDGLMAPWGGRYWRKYKIRKGEDVKDAIKRGFIRLKKMGSRTWKTDDWEEEKLNEKDEVKEGDWE